MGEVIPLRRAQQLPTLQELVDRVRVLSQDSDNIGFVSPHLQQRMLTRGKFMRDILEVLKKGEGVKGPDLDKHGDYRIKLRRCVCGKRTQVIVAVREKDFTVVTVI